MNSLKIRADAAIGKLLDQVDYDAIDFIALQDGDEDD